jgi:hypothetical protein
MASERRIRYTDPYSGETTVVKRYVVSFPPNFGGSDDAAGIDGLVDEYAVKFARGVFRRLALGIMAVTPDGYGTADLDGISVKFEAYKMDRALARVFSEMKLSSGFGGISARDMKSFLDTAAVKVPGFTKTFGSTDQILRKIEQKYDGKPVQ